ncbi:MAG: rod shape-determining protein MreC [Bacteroidales bacterium]|nr:rod shape-determining protein MreC [Bacteroidales bacterium]
MKNLLRFILKYYFILLFVVFEFFGFVILIQNNNFHRSGFINFKHAVEGNFAKRFLNAKDYLDLRNQNRALVREINNLYNLQKNAFRNAFNNSPEILDTLLKQHYVYIDARVINNSTNKQRNYITLNKGSNDGIEPEMAVLANNSIVGVVKKVSPNFSSVISALNRDFAISAKIKKNNYFGPVTWDGRGYREVILSEIPHHVDIQIGDTIISSGFSTTYPEGIMIGTVKDFELQGGNFYQLTVTLTIDFKNLTNVQVVKNLMKQEQIDLETSSTND